MDYLNILKENYLIYSLAINILALMVFWLDKQRAIKKKYRIREILFYLLSLLGGASGILFGIILFKHKVSKNSFSYKILFFFLLNRILEAYIFL